MDLTTAKLEIAALQPLSVAPAQDGASRSVSKPSLGGAISTSKGPPNRQRDRPLRKDGRRHEAVAAHTVVIAHKAGPKAASKLSPCAPLATAPSIGTHGRTAPL